MLNYAIVSLLYSFPDHFNAYNNIEIVESGDKATIIQTAHPRLLHILKLIMTVSLTGRNVYMPYTIILWQIIGKKPNISYISSNHKVPPFALKHTLYMYTMS